MHENGRNVFRSTALPNAGVNGVVQENKVVDRDELLREINFILFSKWSYGMLQCCEQRSGLSLPRGKGPTTQDHQ